MYRFPAEQNTRRQVFCRRMAFDRLEERTLLTTVVWDPAVGGNGHTYQFIESNGVEWDAARDAAVALSTNGVQGHLATITSQAENDFVRDLLATAASDLAISNLVESWLGAEQADPSAPADQTWTWVTGEPFSYTNWDVDEPNDNTGGEQYLGMWGPGPGADGLVGTWNDQGGPNDVFAANNIKGYVVEFPTSTTTEVAIDIKPGSDPNSLNLANNGQIGVAIFTTDEFDAATVDASSVLFAGASAVQSALEDVDGDGDLDMILHFNTQDTNLMTLYQQLIVEDVDADGVLDSRQQEVEVALTGETVLDEAFEGMDDMNLFLSGKNLRELLDDLFA